MGNEPIKETYYVVRKKDGKFWGQNGDTGTSNILDARRFGNPANIETALKVKSKSPTYTRSDYETLVVEASIMLCPLTEPPTNGVVAEPSKETHREVVKTPWGPKLI